ncbi:MAG: MoxR family ATPase, partial [Pseudomonadota bacterium]
MSLDELRALADAIRAEVAKAIVGQDELVDQMLVALVSEGHVLLEGPPGTAKTFLANSFSTALGLDFGRIQFGDRRPLRGRARPVAMQRSPSGS